MKLPRLILCCVLMLLPAFAAAQINTDRMMLMGRNALYYEDYVLSIRRFNMVISSKPYLSEPYFFRGLAKFYLEDYIGAENDCTAAIERNPFVPDNYRLRGLCRINLKRYDEAVADYNDVLEIEPQDENSLHNLALCYVELEEFDLAVECMERMVYYWPKKSDVYTLYAQVCYEKKDTAAAVVNIDKALALNAFDGVAWNMRAAIYADEGDYAAAEEALNKTILQMPFEAGHYINRALTRYHQQNLRGAMADYDTALELDSGNYIGHFNRGLLRSQVGEDNKAIEDFNFVLKLEPDNMIALYNRALLLNNTGDLRGALRDINAIIKEYPNFWAGYQFRAEVYRKMGDTNNAERDEFKVMKAQMDRRYGNKQPQNSTGQTRKASNRNLDDYDKLVEADENDEAPAYESEYRGKVQNRKTELSPIPALALSYYSDDEGFSRRAYNYELERLNAQGVLPARLLLTHDITALDEEKIQKHFASIQELSQKIEQQPDNAMLYFARAIDEYIVQDFERAMLDADKCIENDTSRILFYYLRVQIRMKDLEARAAAGTETQASVQSTAQSAAQTKTPFDSSRPEYLLALDDCDKILALCPDFAGCCFNKGNIYLQMHLWNEAVAAYSKAIELCDDYAEAYYNRGVARILSGEHSAAVLDLSRAGELGLYKAYNLIKRYRERN